MARLAKRPTPDDDSDDQEPSCLASSTQRTPSQQESSPSPAVSFLSDKENHTSSTRRTNGKGKAMSELPTPSSSDRPAIQSNKRRKLGERSNVDPSQVAFQRQKEQVDDKRYYDPDQPMQERRAVRKGIRDLARELTDSRNEFLAAKSTGLVDTITKANDIFANVKQTSDATLDSRLLVTAGDLSARRAIQNKLGGVSSGIDLDEFVSKCISFMRKGPTSERDANLLPSTQSQRRTAHLVDDESDLDNSGDEGDASNWEWLGLKACFPGNVRPPLPGFLLGPLSVQKRARKQTERQQRQQKRDIKDALRPDEIKTQDIERAENANLTTLCRMIYELLYNTIERGKEKVAAEVEARGEDDLAEEEMLEICDRYHIADNEGVSLFHFAFNPRSFGQTVENLFYISFLIRDGKAGVAVDGRGLTTLHATSPSTPQEIKEQGILKRQGVFHLDFDAWRDLCEAFAIRECVIPHRESEGGRGVQVGAKGWYG